MSSPHGQQADRRHPPGFLSRLSPGQQGHVSTHEIDGRLAIAPDTFEIRFPGGDFEYVATHGTVPAVGETIHRRGFAWVVTRVVEDGASTVYVERADEQLGETG